MDKILGGKVSKRLYYAVGSFHMRSMLIVKDSPECTECEKHLTMVWSVRDDYDWHGDLTVKPFGVTIPDSYALELEKCERDMGVKNPPAPFQMRWVRRQEIGCVCCLPG